MLPRFAGEGQQAGVLTMERTERDMDNTEDQNDSICIKLAETDEELCGRGYVHCTSWQEAYRGIVSDRYLDSMTVEATTARARQFPENTLVAKDREKVVGFAVYGSSRDEDLMNAGEVIAIYVLSEYYNRKERCVIRKGDKKGYQDNWKPYFNNYIVVGMTIGIYDGDGTDSSKVHKLYTPFYNIYKKNMSGDCDSIMLDRTIKSYNSCAKPVVGSFEAPNGDRHSMAILGYYDVEVYYKKGSKNKLKTYRYYAVNDGHKTCYEGNYRVQYISDKYIEYIYKLD